MKPDLVAIKKRAERFDVRPILEIDKRVLINHVVKKDIPALLAYIAELEAERQWVPVSPDTMPEDGQRIIVNDVKLGFGVGTYRKDMTLHDKTHWMPLPPLPGTEGE